MPRIPRHLLPHRLRFRPVVGEGANGRVLGDQVDVPAYIEDKTRMVYVGGAQVASTVRVWVDHDVPVTLDSEVTIPTRLPPGERTTSVLAIAVFDHPGAVSHLQLDLA